MEQKRSVRLVLKTSDLTPGSTTNIGTCDTSKTTFTWNNINLRMLMGDDLYGQYDYFNISLNCVASTMTLALGADTNDSRLVYIKLQGLPFINQTYQQPTNNNGQYVYASIFQIPATTSTTNIVYYSNSSNVFTFSKSQDCANITIALTQVVNDVKPAPTNAFPNFSFMFNIVGIDKADNPDKINYSMKL